LPGAAREDIENDHGFSRETKTETARKACALRGRSAEHVFDEIGFTH